MRGNTFGRLGTPAARARRGLTKLSAAACAVTLLAGCGSSDEEPPPPQVLETRTPTGDERLEVRVTRDDADDPDTAARRGAQVVLRVQRARDVLINRQVFQDGEDMGALRIPDVDRRPYQGPVEIAFEGQLGEDVSLGTHVPDAEGDLPLPLSTLALATLGAGMDVARLRVTAEDARTTDATLELPDLLDLADLHTQRQTDPALEAWAIVGEDPRWVFWTVVHHRARTEALRDAAAARLQELEGGPQDPAALALLVDGRGSEVLADGVLVDWDPRQGPLGGHPRAQARLQVPDQVSTRDPLWLVVECTNVGKGPLHQLRGTLRSSSSWVDGYHVLFGRVPPGYTVTRRIELPVPAAWPGGPEEIHVDFAEQHGYRPDGLQASTWVRGGGAPEMTLTWYVIDDGSGGTVGNADGLAQPGEAVDVRVTVDNRGNRTAIEPALTLTLDAVPGARLVPRPGEAVVEEAGPAGPTQALTRSLSTLAPGQTSDELRFTISLSESLAPGELDVALWIREASDVQADTLLPIQVRIHAAGPADEVGGPLREGDQAPPDETSGDAASDQARGTPLKLGKQVFEALQQRDGDLFVDAWLSAEDARFLSDEPLPFHQRVLQARNDAWVALNRGHPDLARATFVSFEGQPSQGALGEEVHDASLVYAVDGEERSLPLAHMVKVADGRWRMVRALPQ